MRRNQKILLKEFEVRSTINKIVNEILKKKKDLSNVVFIGILSRGIYLAQRISEEIKKIKKVSIPVGMLDITFYRDDVDSIAKQPVAKETKIPFDLTDKEVILVDDVLFTGRSTRAALDEIMDFGRPRKIQLAVLIDRSHREIPIHADFIGLEVETDYEDRVEVKLKEADGKDEVVLIKNKNATKK